ncbi:MAG TPA: single-stranded-DNA-specific exonuclease RecJ, partial [Terriglobia bacterium]|nr:single-stranded-DNA-specific exonuclease RecJ [Terriglobia bacterium]
MRSKLWVIRQVDPIQRGFLSQALSISSATASLLLNRGVTDVNQATAWMSPLRTHDPFLIPDMESAVDRLFQAMQ